MTKKTPSSEDKPMKTFDMYHFFSRKDVVLAMAFVIAFLIFAVAIALLPQPV